MNFHLVISETDHLYYMCSDPFYSASTLVFILSQMEDPAGCVSQAPTSTGFHLVWPMGDTDGRY